MEAATDWLLVIEEDPDIATSEPFERWLNASPMHRQAYRMVADAFGATAPEQLGQGQHLLVLDRRLMSLRRRLFAPVSVKPRYVLAGLAALVFVALLAPSMMTPPVTPAFYHAGKGEVRTIALADKSILFVDTDTSAAVLQSDESRIVDLDHGRVFVDVQGGDRRVFKVTSGPMAFTATGTAYSVLTTEGGYRLDVYEGTVEIRRDDRLLGAVHAGGGARVTGNSLDRFAFDLPAGPAQPDWTQNRITFAATPLAEAVAAFNRYSSKKIVLADTSLQGQPVSGVFALNDVDAFVRSVGTVMDTGVRETDTQVIIGQ